MLTMLSCAPMSIYLAGKIAQNDWRHDVVGQELRYAWGSEGAESTFQPWPKLPTTFPSLRYVGPYFMSDDHGCGHGPGTHGCGDGGCGSNCPAPSRGDIVDRCQLAIKRADIVFVWLDDEDCTAYGSLVEIGYALGLGKPVTVAAPEGLERWLFQDLWFALYAVNEIIIADSPQAAVKKVADTAAAGHYTSLGG